MVTAEGGVRDFDIGRIVRRAFDAIGRNAPGFFTLALLAMGPSMVLDGISSSFDKISNILWSVLSSSLEGALIFAAMSDFRGEKASLSACFTAGARYFWPIFGISILYSLGVLLGLVLLVVPGILWAMSWLVVGPVRVVEGARVSDCFGRSAELTKGYRWKILLLVLAVLVAAIVLGVALLAPIAIFGDSLAPVNIEGPVSDFVVAVFTVVMAVVTTSIYYELRTSKEGVGTEQVSAVFD
jgi:uncharacterized membrane protein